MDYTHRILVLLLAAVMSTGSIKPETPGKSDNNSSFIIQYGDLTFSANKILKTEPELFRLMNFQLLEPITDPEDFTEGIILPLKSKKLLFGDDSAIGKTLIVDSFSYQVIGVVKDVPERSCLCSDIIILSNEVEVPFERLANIRFSIIY